MTASACTAPGCERTARSSGALYCEMHYYRLRRTGQLELRPRPRRQTVTAKPKRAPKVDVPCPVEGCDRLVTENGMCKKHSTRVRRNGDPHAFTHQRDRKLARGAANVHWTGDAVTYEGIHQRVRAAMGSATEHPCADCGRPAKHWSYDQKDPDERTGPLGAFSTQIRHYVPRCVPCHKRFDLSVKPMRRLPLDLDQIRSLHAQGIRVTPMAKLMGVSRGRIERALDTLGLPRFPPGNPRPGVRRRAA